MHALKAKMILGRQVCDVHICCQSGFHLDRHDVGQLAYAECLH